MSANIDEIWASMNEDSASFAASVSLGTAYSSTCKKKAETGTGKVKIKSKKKQQLDSSAVNAAQSSITAVDGQINNSEDKLSKTKKAKKSSASIAGTSISQGPEEAISVNVPLISYSDATTLIARDIQASSENDINVRKTALSRIYKLLFVEHSLAEEDYSEVFRDTCKPIFKRFADSSEKCRELALRITKSFFERSSDIAPVLGYFFPALMQRLPSGIGFDEEMKVFVVDMEQHEAFRRGRAVDRQDKRSAESGGAAAAASQKIVEPSEEIRLLTLSALFSLVQRVQIIGACPILHPYFQEVVGFTQMQLNDPFPELKVLACTVLQTLATIEDFEPGMKFFAVGLVRAILPVLRHRLSKVRIPAVSALRTCMVVPDRAKRKASGSEAITDLCGFRDENILPIAAFYKADVTINFLAELVADSSLQVREELVSLLTVLLTEIGDRYDHQTRLLPYLLDLMTDSAESVSQGALACLQQCGREYEFEHEDEVRDRRQYGVDGDDRINLTKPPPAPFHERPRIGMRLYVRGNCKRFLNALVAELTNWVGQTRLKSAKLLKMIIVLCEEHLTMEAHSLLPAFIKALKFARDDELGKQSGAVAGIATTASSDSLHAVLLEVYELLGRYLAPEVYIYFILPRLRGDADVVQFGVDAATRITVMEFLRALLLGSKPSLIVPHVDELINALTDPFIISADSAALQCAALHTLTTIFEAMRSKGNAVVEAHFVSTGRITSLQKTVRTAFKYLLVQISNPELQILAAVALKALSELESDAVTAAALSSTPALDSIDRLYRLHTVQLAQELMQEYKVDEDWSSRSAQHLLLERLVQSPTAVLQQDATSLSKLLGFLTGLLLQQPEQCQRSTGGGSKIQILDSDDPGNRSDLSTEGELELLARVNRLLVFTVKCALAVDASQLHAIVREHVQLLLSACVVDVRWARSTTLQCMRIELLKLLLGESVNDEPLGTTIQTEGAASSIGAATALHGRGLNNNGSELQRKIVKHVMGDFVRQETSQITVAAIITGDLLTKTFSSIATSVLHAAMNPQQPSSLRMDALEFTASCLSRLAAAAFADAATTDAAAAPTSLRSFAYYRSSMEAAAYQRLLQCKLAAASSIAFLCAELDDGDDDVRARCVQLIGCPAAACLLLSSDDVSELRNNNSQSLSPATPPYTSPSTVGTAGNFGSVVEQLLLRATVRESEQFFCVLSDALRMICVLHPAKFERIVRAVAPTITTAAQKIVPEEASNENPDSFDNIATTTVAANTMSAQPSERISEFVSGLINHVDILQQFGAK